MIINDVIVFVTEPEITAALDAVVEELGEDYVYEYTTAELTREGKAMCNYVAYKTGVSRGLPEDAVAPRCIAGRVLHKIGVPLEFLADFEGMGVSAFIRDDDSECDTALRRAQWVQDQGRTYGEAREAYRDKLKEYES